MERPNQIKSFERLYLACIAIAFAQTAVDDLPTGGVLSSLLIFAFGFGLSLALTFLVSCRRSRIAMWILVAFFFLGLPSDAANMTGSESNLSIALTFIRVLVEGAALGFLFTRPAREWFRRIPDDRMLQETFS